MIHPRWLIVAPIVALTAALGVARSPAVEISGVVFEDTNRNGTRDAGERGVAGVAVSNQDTVVTTDAYAYGPDGAITSEANPPATEPAVA